MSQRTRVWRGEHGRGADRSETEATGELRPKEGKKRQRAGPASRMGLRPAPHVLNRPEFPDGQRTKPCHHHCGTFTPQKASRSIPLPAPDLSATTRRSKNQSPSASHQYEVRTDGQRVTAYRPRVAAARPQPLVNSIERNLIEIHTERNGVLDILPKFRQDWMRFVTSSPLSLTTRPEATRCRCTHYSKAIRRKNGPPPAKEKLRETLIPTLRELQCFAPSWRPRERARIAPRTPSSRKSTMPRRTAQDHAGTPEE